MEERFNPENIEMFKQQKEKLYQSLVSILSENTITEEDKLIFADAVNVCIIILEESQLPLLESKYKNLELQTTKLKKLSKQNQEELSQLKAEVRDYNIQDYIL